MAIDFNIREFCHPLRIMRLWRTLNRTQWLPPEELDEYCNTRVRAVVRHAFEHVPYYSELMKAKGVPVSSINSAEDLEKLPLLTKDAVRGAGEKLVADNAGRYGPVEYSTSGTTGKPLKFYLDAESNSLEFVYYWRHWSWAGYRLGDRFAELGSQYFLRRPSMSQRATGWQPHLNRLMVNSCRISIDTAREIADAIRRRRPRFLKGMASPVYFLALSFRECGINDIRFKAVFSTGEVLGPRYREVIESVFGCRALDSYGHMERTAGICECLEGGYHVNTDYGLLQTRDVRKSPDGSVMIGRAVGTSLYNMAMPLVRYDIGDDIELLPEARECPCGRTLPLVKAVHGRSEDTIVTPDGRFITSIFILPEFVEGIRFAQFVQSEKDRLEILVVPGPSWTADSVPRLDKLVRDMVGSAMQVSVRVVDETGIITDKSGKRRVVISSFGQSS